VLRTNARVTPLQAVLRYRDLLQVEDLFRRAKAILRTRPIYHSSDTPSAAMCSARSWP
jgi:transposase